MSAEDRNAIESKYQALLGQLKAAEGALRAGLHTHGFGSTARAHMERALTHIAESYIALTEPKQARTVRQLVDDLNRIQQVTDDIKRRQHNSQRL
jgi:transcriptional/translational regulatory protein YebC/TACO1